MPLKGMYGKRRTVTFEARDKGTGDGTGDGTGIEATGGVETAGVEETGGVEEPIEFIEPQADRGKTIDIGDASGFAGEANNGKTETPRKGPRKGWKRSEAGSGQARKKVSTPLEGLETLLHTIHLSLSLMTHVPEFVITKEEADLQAKAYAKVASLYDLGATEEMIAWANLVTVLGAQYGTRYLAYTIRTKNEAAAKPKPFLVNQ